MKQLKRNKAVIFKTSFLTQRDYWKKLKCLNIANRAKVSTAFIERDAFHLVHRFCKNEFTQI
jgi:hypothetical protein